MNTFIITKVLNIVIILSLCLVISNIALAQQTVGGKIVENITWNGQEIPVIQGEIILKLASGLQRSAVMSKLASDNIEVAKVPNKLGWMTARISATDNLLEALVRYQNTPGVLHAEPNIVTRTTVSVNDLNEKQWSLRNTGQSPANGTNGADIDATESWDVTTGSSDVVIAVLDTGIPMLNGTLSHPDLNDTGKIIQGDDFIEPNQANGVKDEYGHGTHVAGIAAAESNNGTGIAGTCWNCKVLVIQVFDAYGSGTYQAFHDGVVFASDYQRDNPSERVVINYSGGGPSGSTYLTDAIEYAANEDVLIIASAGNENGGNVLYPAAYTGTYNNLVAVSSTDPSDTFSSFSSQGSQVSISAPGGYGYSWDGNQIRYDNPKNVYSTTPNYSFNMQNDPAFQGDPYTSDVTQSYGYLPGTSMAAPHVAGVAALMQSVNPNLTPAQIRTILQNTADEVSGMGGQSFTNQYGHGRLNAYEAVKAALPNVHSTHIGSDQTYGYTLLTGSNTVDEDTDLTIQAGEAVVLEGSLTGTFDAQLKIYGTLIVEEDAVVSQLQTTVYSGGRLIIRPGAEFTFRNNQQFNVQSGAELIAVGTSAKPIVFDKATGSNWRYLYLQGMAELKHVIISNTQYGVYLNGNDLLDMSDSKISNSSSFGIYAITGYMDLFRSVVENSGSDGINASNYSLINDVLNSTPVNVVIRNNSRYGIFANNYSEVYLSQWLTNYGGYNSIYGNTSYHLYATNYSEIASALTWWGQYPINTADYFKDSSSLLYYGGSLSSNPNPSMKILPTNAPIAGNSHGVTSGTNEHAMRSSFMTRLAELRRAGNKEGVFAYVLDIANNPTHEYHRQAKLALIQALSAKGDYSASNALAYSILNDGSETQEDQLFAGVQLIQNQLDHRIFGSGVDNSREIPSLIDRLDQLGLDEEQVAMYRDLLNGNEDDFDIQSQHMNDIVVTNHPNPFNPNTNIQFTLPEQADVTLKVYDLVGREIAVLVQGRMEAGTQSVSFDASRLASGMYLYILQAGSTRITQKMTLIK